MYNDNYYPSMAEDDITSDAAYSEYDSEPYTSDEWLNSQETTPILPLPEDGSDWSDQVNDFDMQDMAASPRQAMPRHPAPDRPVAPLPDRPGRPIPDRPGWPDRPVPPIPDRPVAPLPDRPGRPIPDRPGWPNRPVPPVRPDWSWNWGTILPGIVLPLSPARVRFYNAAVRGPVQIYVNNRLVVSNLNFLNYSRIYNVIPGRYRITVYRGNNMRSPLVDTWMSFRQNQDYTVALVGSGSNFQLQTISF
ncbi:MAG: DUF4397 domain-containing protein [Clostridia bacterium]|nr:DUF4397 domain-containing protein [Clostridia bacterium]